MIELLDKMLEYALSGTIALLGWVGIRLHRRVDTLEKDMAEHKIKMAERTFTKDEIRLMFADLTGAVNRIPEEIKSGDHEIWNAITRLSDKLDAKADK